VRDPWNDSELVAKFRTHERTSMPRAPLNSALSAVIAGDRSLSSMLGHAPLTQQTPVMLLAAIHHLVLGEPAHPLAEWYPNVTSEHRPPDDLALATVLTDFVSERAPAIFEILETRAVQTNEVGRCAVFIPVFAGLAKESGRLAHLDVGASAGLTTLSTSFGYRYDDGEVVGRSPLVIDCSTRGPCPALGALPTVAAARGLDLSPIDVTDPDDARWLQACCWPDQIDRFERLRSAIDIAVSQPPIVDHGDAVDDLAGTLLLTCDGAPDAHPVITTSWVLSYLSATDQRRFVAEVDRIGAARDLTWLMLESPAQTAVLPHDPSLAGEHLTAVSSVSWRSGTRTVDHLGVCHPHGYWIHWKE